MDPKRSVGRGGTRWPRRPLAAAVVVVILLWAILSRAAPLGGEKKPSSPPPAVKLRAPTFWTAELAAGIGALGGAEHYEPGPDVALRMSFGGRLNPLGCYAYVVGGFQLAHLWGDHRGGDAVLGYQRTQLVGFIELRVALPVALGGRTRLFVGAGGGFGYERLSVGQSGGSQIIDEGWRSEIRLLAGVWQRISESISLYADYRLRALFGGSAHDPIGDLIGPGSLGRTFPAHALEVGGALHF